MSHNIQQQLDAAITLLAEWCVAIDVGGTGWDYWDECYKEALYRPSILRELLDKRIEEVRKQYEH